MLSLRLLHEVHLPIRGKKKLLFAHNRGHQVDFCPHALWLQVLVNVTEFRNCIFLGLKSSNKKLSDLFSHFLINLTEPAFF